MEHKRLQEMLDKAADQAATQAAALVINQLRPALKKAITEIFKDYGREFISNFFISRWLRVVVGILTILGLIGLWIKERM